MIIPSNYTEEEVLDIIETIVNKLSYSFRFGYFDVEDIKQEGRIEALKALERYEPPGPLENFLYIHVRNQLINLKKKKYGRNVKPCLDCPFYDPNNLKSDNQCAVFADKMECDKYNSWRKRQSTRHNLMYPIGIQNVMGIEDEDGMKLTSNVVNNAYNKEILRKIDENLPASLRGDYLKMKAGVKISRHRRLKVLEECKRIIHGEDDGEEG